MSQRVTESQITDTILMVRPANFGFNPETAANNAFQEDDPSLNIHQRKQIAREEFDAFVATLREAGVNVIVIEDSEYPVKTDSVFPNNWITTHLTGTIVTYPIFAVGRRPERREEIINELAKSFLVLDRWNLEHFEENGQFLEGTGSLILDRTNRISYACLSARTDLSLLEYFSNRSNYEVVSFHAVDGNDVPIYHTNVMMALGQDFVVICLDTIHDPSELTMLKNHFARTKKEIIEISLDQMNAFAGNMLQVRNAAGDTFLVMSQQAFESLTKDQIDQIERFTNILYSPIPIIEKYGGGSARCMMAEIFLPPK